jgi:hypothetical protein
MSDVYVYENGTNVRMGGAIPRKDTDDPDNVVAVINKGHYRALYQCAGQDWTEGNYSNYWWVKIEYAPGKQGWVSAVRIQGGDNDQPIKNVDLRPTAFV